MPVLLLVLVLPAQLQVLFLQLPVLLLPARLLVQLSVLRQVQLPVLLPVQLQVSAQALLLEYQLDWKIKYLLDRICNNIVAMGSVRGHGCRV